MKTQLDVKKLIERGVIQTELELERANLADRKLRILAKENPKFKVIRNKLRDLIEEYEAKNWSKDSQVNTIQYRDSDIAESIVEMERQFIEKRKELIKNKLKRIGLTQQDFGKLLGHDSKSYTSELMNGIRPFCMNDLVIIHRLFKIELGYLVPTFLTQLVSENIKLSIEKLEKPELKLSIEDLIPV